MVRNALGLIESVGLIGAIEAADAAAKAAAVQLRKSEVTSSALVTIHIEGELGAVQAAVEAGAAACQKVGQLLSMVIIPRPDPGLDVMLDMPSNLYVPGGPFCAIVPQPKAPPKAKNKTGSTKSPPAKPKRGRSRGKTTGTGGDYESMTVQALRRLARMRPNLAIAGRDIARAGKDTLIQLLRDADKKD
jgi:ethanolamine utilization protein EutM